MIPKWNISGVLPPIFPGEPGHSDKRSPYKVELSEVIEEFSISSQRRVILKGLLDYRQALFNVGITSGFQWLDGSFLENVEITESRPPNDIDVVSFFSLPSATTQIMMLQKNPDLFQPKKTKQNYHVDAYPFILGDDTREHHVKMISYWYSMWSHRRDGLWKGFVQVELSELNDKKCHKLLEQIEKEEA